MHTVCGRNLRAFDFIHLAIMALEHAFDDRLDARLSTLFLCGSLHLKNCKGGVLTYENGSHSQVKFFDYTPVLYAYSNYSTVEYFVARVNEYVGTFNLY